jgi:glycosyltransferase involved in cell wall biosynthesis
LKIAVYHNLPSGGGKRALFEMVKHLSGSHELEAFTTSSAEHDFCDIRPFVARYSIYPFIPLKLLRSPFGRLNPILRTIDLYRLDSLQRRIAQEIDKQNYDLVFVHNCRVSQAPGMIRYLHTKSVYYCGEPPRGFTEPRPVRPYDQRSSRQRLIDHIDPLPGFYRRTLLQLDRSSTLTATKILVNSAYSRETFYRVYGYFATTSYLGVDHDKFRPLGLSKQYYVCSVGSLTAKKGFDFLIESLGFIPPDQRPALILACNHIEPLEKEYVEGLAQRFGVRLEIRSMISDDDIVQLYNQALLTLYTPVMEPFGFVPLESMACGTAVIGVCEGGVRETIIDGYNGILVDRDPKRFSEAVIKLITEADNTERLEQQARRNILDKWTWEKSVAELEYQLESTAFPQN